MRIHEVIHRKGGTVVTVRPDDDIAQLLDLLAEHHIGAAVVSEDGTTVAGIVSERDVVRQLRSDGAGILQQQVRSIMTTTVQTCTPEDELEALARQMTEHRIRHVPVLVDDELVAIVSIGDIVKNRIDELQTERDQLVGYIQR